jgi:dihydrofolate synthase/folylpolyglutamate synthase
MSYAAAIDQLNAMVPELYTGTGQQRRKFSLDEVRTLLHALGDPHLKFRSVLIAGTNGKGSTAATLASILTSAGQHTGLYTSPHLEKPNERICVDRKEIADEDFARHYFRMHNVAQELVDAGRLAQLPSYFEALTAQAFLYFAERKVDIAVLEVGMGGRLDATNVVEPLISIVTDISLDHMEWLGPTITAITREKAGILRRGGTMITLPQHPEANQVLGEVATELGVRGVNAIPYLPVAKAEGPGTVEALGARIIIDSPLAGGHQQRNLALAVAAAVELAGAYAIPITPAALEEGVRRTRWPGRLERIRAAGVDWILDVAHNPAGAWALRTGLPDVLGSRKPQTLIFSCLRDKPLGEMAQILFPVFEQVVVAPVHNARAAALDDLLAAARATGTPTVAAQSVREALQMVQDRSAGGVAVVSGSVYLVGEARALLLAGKSEST